MGGGPGRGGATAVQCQQAAKGPQNGSAEQRLRCFVTGALCRNISFLAVRSVRRPSKEQAPERHAGCRAKGASSLGRGEIKSISLTRFYFRYSSPGAALSAARPQPPAASWPAPPPLAPPLPLHVLLSLRPQVDGTVVSSIGPGLLCLVGLRDTDTEKDTDYM